MKKFIYSIAVLAGVCLAINLSSCKELEKVANSIDKEQRADIIGVLLADGLSAMSGDSLSFLAGTWVFTDGQNTFDTLWIATDSTITNHFKNDEVDLLQTGGYLYYQSYKQALVQYNSAYNYKTKKEVQGWSNTLIYNVSKTKFTLLNMNQLTLMELDQETGESLGSTAYTLLNDEETPSMDLFSILKKSSNK